MKQKQKAPSHQIEYVHANLYQITKNRPSRSPANTTEDVPTEVTGDAPGVTQNLSRVLTAKDHNRQTEQVSLPQKKHEVSSRAEPMVVGIRENLKVLDELHSRLRFVLKDLEDLVHEAK